MPGARWVDLDGARIIECDYAGAGSAQTLDVLAEIRRLVADAPDRLLMLADATDATFSPAFLADAKRLNHDVFGPGRAKIAVYGVGGIVRAMMRGFNAVGGGSQALAFRDRDAALAFLLR